ncbi:hypothetical protein BRD10_02480 [Halobacteriales archaeon SW_12_71_31]|nr:MAG: hypothetical protein BRD10_02480 [Halobacteriales archaeon SW_12_71_31]
MQTSITAFAHAIPWRRERRPAASNAAAEPWSARTRSAAATITATLRVFPGDADEPTAVTAVRGRGHPDLTFESDRGAVCRTADYVDDRTVMVDADRAAADLDREVVAALSKTETDLLVELSVDPP